MELVVKTWTVGRNDPQREDAYIHFSAPSAFRAWGKMVTAGAREALGVQEARVAVEFMRATDAKPSSYKVVLTCAPAVQARATEFVVERLSEFCRLRATTDFPPCVQNCPFLSKLTLTLVDSTR